MGTKIKRSIDHLQKERDKFITLRDISWDEDNQKYTDKDSETKMDELANQIFESLKENLYSLNFEYIIENLTMLGHAPNLLYDDNGRFAVIGDGMSSMVFDGPDDWSGHFFVKKEKWFNTIREALHNYLNT
jgi:hypothetical protein